MTYPDRREGDTPIITDLFPLGRGAISSSIRDIFYYDRVIGERSIFTIDNELLLLHLESVSINSNPTLMSFYQKGMLLSHRALRAEADARDGILTSFDNELLSKYINSFADLNKEKLLARSLAFFQRQGLSYEEAMKKLFERYSQTTIKEVNDAYQAHFETSQAAFKKQEQPFYQAMTREIGGQTTMEQNATFGGASQVWAAFKFASQRPAA